MIKFGTGGFRGIIGDDFNKANIQKIAQGLSNIVLRKEQTDKPIIVGYDNRFMSDYYAGWMAEVFAGNGIKTLMYTLPVPTPAVMCSTKDMGNEYGVMITASHNPYIYNGVKLFLKTGIDANVEFTNALDCETNAVEEVKVMRLSKAKECGLVEDFDNINQYLQNVKKFILPEVKNNNVKIIFDNMFGVGKVGLEKLAVDFNIRKFVMLNAARDAFFNFELPNPVESALLHLKNKVTEGNFDYAIATDSDADRLGVIDDKGNYVDSNNILGALYYYLIRYRGMKGDVVKNFSTSILMDKIAAKLGYVCHEVDVGFKNISSKMKEVDALIGGESSGGLTVRNYLFGKDSIFSATLFMEMQIMMNKPVSDIIKEVHSFAEYTYATAEDSMDFDNEKLWLKLYNGTENPFGADLLKVQTLNNNIKFHFSGNRWLLLRKSGTEALLRIVSEMSNPAESRGMLKKTKEYLNGFAK